MNDYNLQCELQKPEQAILDELKNKLPFMKMLDIGVGAARTTTYFACLVGEYVGVDYSQNMINASRRKFPQYTFKVADARNLSDFEEDYFDFVLFSFNGIDSVDHRERLRILHEIRRVIKKGGYFCFSAHNLNSYSGRIRSIKFPKNPALLVLRSYSLLQTRLLNMKTWRDLRNPSSELQHMMIFHASERANRRLHRIYWLTPTEQLKQLLDNGFGNIRVYGLDGREIANPESCTLQHEKDDWLYYLCQPN
ncbi:MAG: class I SAM-dependent methyltransferase [Candidatus Bathyarchaeia archaeon]